MLDLRPLKIVVTGGSGFVGKHLVRALRDRGCENVFAPTRKACDLFDERQIDAAFSGADVVFHLAAKCGGIGANRASPADFINDNLQMGLNVIRASLAMRVRKLVLVGSLCSYPEGITRPIEPDDLWGGYPEPTNAPYGIAKRTLIEISKAYRSQYGLNAVNVVPCNMYGPGDNFDPQTSHVIPAMIRRFVEAKESGAESVTCWGTGLATRDFLYVTDAVEGLIRAAERIEDSEPVLLGSGRSTRMKELATLIANIVGYRGRIEWDNSKPDGQPYRCVSTRSQNQRLGFVPKVELDIGIESAVKSYVEETR